jgi:hypothetical protein
MTDALSKKSDMNRMDAAAALSSVINCDDLRVFSFSNKLVEVPARRGMSGVDAVINSQQWNGTDLGGAVRHILTHVEHDRLIVITDEQSCTPVPDPIVENSYMINVASSKNGVGYGKWKHIDGFSEGIIRYIAETENDRR